MSEAYLIVGATSGIAAALCQVLAARGCALILAGRRKDALEAMAADIRVRHQTLVYIEPFDATDFDAQPGFVERAFAQVGGKLDGVVVCHGTLPDADASKLDPQVARACFDVNLTSCVTLLTLLARRFEAQRSGSIAVISSVAGDRGRQSNYPYGAAKAGLSAFVDGLRNRLHPSGVHVLLIKPGFVDTPMTAGKIDPKSPLVASPERVAKDIDRALQRKRDVLYTPWFWRCIMGIVCWIPEFIFKRMKM